MIQLSPEEDEKRRLRRERNKIAAAKCRNRRRDLTDTLQAVSIYYDNVYFSYQSSATHMYILTLCFCHRKLTSLRRRKPLCKLR